MESDFLPCAEVDNSFTYVRNAFSDEAYEVFSSTVDDATVRYSSNFKECFDAVACGAVSYCLLPLEERGGVRLPTVSELIYRNDFKINAVTPVFGMDNNADLKYAMVSKYFGRFDFTEDDDVYLEIRIGQECEDNLPSVVAAAAHLGHTVYRVNTSTVVTEGEEETFFSVVFRAGNSGFTSFLVYLTLFARDFTPVGLYKNLE